MGIGKRQGFSLLEVVIATFIFLIVLGAFQGYMVTISRMAENSRGRMAATFVAEQVLEEFLTKGFDRTDELPTSGTVTLDVTMYGKPKHYSITYQVNVVEISEELKSVQVAVNSTQSKDLRFETLLCKSL